ncbi:MAG: hypothetical protein CMN30_20795 [Sandaracinus sp.]|nr:hypothetical protein [Sandaracinus sp.]
MAKAALCFALAVGSALLGAPATAHAQEASDDLDQEARALFEAGRVAFDAGRYEDALEHFEDAYARSRRPRLLYNVGLAADRVGDVQKAIRAYDKFLAMVEDSPHRPTVEERLAALRAQPTAEPAAPMTIVEQQPVTPATPPTATTAPSFPTHRGPDSSDDAGPSRLAPVLTLVGGAVLAVGGLALVAAALPARADAEDATTWPAADEANQQARLRSGAGYILLGVGAAAALAGIVWLRVRTRAAYDVALGPSGVQLRGTF